MRAGKGEVIGSTPIAGSKKLGCVNRVFNFRSLLSDLKEYRRVALRIEVEITFKIPHLLIFEFDSCLACVPLIISQKNHHGVFFHLVQKPIAKSDSLHEYLANMNQIVAVFSFLFLRASLYESRGDFLLLR